MNIKRIQNMASGHQPNAHKVRNLVIAFVSGGCVGLFAQIVKAFVMQLSGCDSDMAGSYAIVTVIILTSLFTGLGLYEKLAQHCGAGLFIPISGFSNALTSCALEGKSEGLIYGIGSRMFALAGSVITYGIVSAAVFGFLRFFLFGGA